MLDLRLPTTLVYCRMICFGSKRKKGFDDQGYDDQRRPVNELEILEGETMRLGRLGSKMEREILGWDNAGKIGWRV